jgi:hypothetical protein
VTTRVAIDEIPGVLAADPDTPCVEIGDRYVVVYAVSYDHDDESSASGEEVRSAREAAHYALKLTRDAGSSENIWRVFDTLTGKWATFAQQEIERA